MTKLDSIKEFGIINFVTHTLRKHPKQINNRHESDAEIIEIHENLMLALTIDSLEEEYRLGLIRNPKTVGWCSVVQSLSDLAAVNAKPIGVLLAVNFPDIFSTSWLNEYFVGVQEALEAHNTYCLGGDTNSSECPSFTCAALGLLENGTLLSRIGGKAGELLYTTAPIGAGNLLGITKHFDVSRWEKLEKNFRPKARFTEVQVLRRFMSCAIDTSDSLLQVTAILAELNDLGAELFHFPEIYDQSLPQLAQEKQFPLWLVNVFGMGEFEILFSVPPALENELIDEAKKHAIPIQKIGKFRQEPGISIQIDGKNYELDVPYLLNLFSQCSSITEYLQKLIQYDSQLRH